MAPVAERRVRESFRSQMEVWVRQAERVLLQGSEGTAGLVRRALMLWAKEELGKLIHMMGCW